VATVLPTLLAFGRESVVFAIEETVTLVETKPTTTSQILMAGDGSVSQELGFIPDPQRRNTYSALPDIPGRYDAGALSFPMLVKPRALGVAPDGGQVLKNLFGRETIVGGTSVTYNLLRTTDIRKSETVWIKNGHFLYRCIGTVFTKGAFPIKADNSEDALCQVKLDATCAEVRWTGTDELAVITAAIDTTITVKDARKFTVDSYIEIGAQTNTGAGFKVTAVNYTTNVLTITPAVGAVVAVDALVKPWIPVGSENGTIVHGRFGAVTRGGETLPLMSGEIGLDFPVKMMNEEKNGQDFASRFATANIRTVNADVQVLFDANAAKWFYDGKQGVLADMVCNWGTVAAQRVRITAKNQLLSAPAISGAEERVIDLKGKAFASTAYDDEITMVLD
jgi:hypothetical protein